MHPNSWWFLLQNGRTCQILADRCLTSWKTATLYLLPTILPSFHFCWKGTFLHRQHIPDRTTRASAGDLRAPLTYWRLSAGQTYSQPKASWYWDRTPGFHLSTREEGERKKGNLTKYWHAYNENNFLTGRRWNANSNEEANWYLISKQIPNCRVPVYIAFYSAWLTGSSHNECIGNQQKVVSTMS